MAGPQLNFLTLACADVERMADFLRARDPAGNIWDVAWKKGSTVTPAGDLTWS